MIRVVGVLRLLDVVIVLLVPVVPIVGVEGRARVLRRLRAVGWGRVVNRPVAVIAVLVVLVVVHGIAVVLAIGASILAHRGHPPSTVVGLGTSCAAAASEAPVVFDGLEHNKARGIREN